ncbi:Argininosuccinate synthase, partial [Trachymyrmex septentrionalis]
PCISQSLIKAVKAEDSSIIAHGITRKWNNQVRFELNCYNLYSKLTMTIDPVYSLEQKKFEISFKKKYPINVKSLKDRKAHGIGWIDIVLLMKLFFMKFFYSLYNQTLISMNETGRLAVNATGFIRTQALKLKEFCRFQ